jgi:hypothetical protein
VERNARRDEKARARAEREAARAKATKSADREPDYDAFPRRDVSSQRDESPSNVLEQVAAPKKAGSALPKSLNDEVDRNESQVASAAAAWLVLPATDGTGDSAQSLQDANQDANAAATTIAAAVPLPADGMRPADGTPAADPDAVATFAGAPAPAPAESTWLGYLFMTLGGALAAASTVRYLLV